MLWIFQKQDELLLQKATNKWIDYLIVILAQNKNNHKLLFMKLF